MNHQQAREMVLSWQQGVDAEHARATSTAAPSGLESIGASLASFGKAALNRPDLMLQMAAGAGVTVLGGAVATGGVALNVTGVGAVVGVPANVAGGLVAGSGLGLIGLGAHGLAEEARMNPADPIQFNILGFGKSKGNEGKAESPQEKTQGKEDKIQKKIDEQRQNEKDAVTERMGNLGGGVPKKTPGLFWFQE